MSALFEKYIWIAVAVSQRKRIVAGSLYEAIMIHRVVYDKREYEIRTRGSCSETCISLIELISQSVSFIGFCISVWSVSGDEGAALDAPLYLVNFIPFL